MATWKDLDDVSMQTTRPTRARTDDDCWSVCSADNVYPPVDHLSDLVSRSESILANLNKKDINLPPTNSTENDLDYESDYGPPGGSIGRMPSRRFGSRRSKRVRNMSNVPLPEVKPLSICRPEFRISSAGSAPSRHASVSTDPSLRNQPLSSPVEQIETFEEALAHMSETPIRTPPSRSSSKTTKNTIVSNISRSSSDYYSTSSTVNDGHNTRSISTRSRSSSMAKSPGRLGRSNSSSLRRLDEKSLDMGCDADMVDIPIVDDDGRREALGITRGPSANSADPENPLPPYTAFSLHGSAGQPDAGQTGQPEGSMGKEGSVLYTIRLVVVILALVLAVLIVGLNINIITPTTPRETKNAADSLKGTTWYVSAYLWGLCAFQLLFGRLYIEYTPHWVFAAALLVFEIGSLFAAVAPFEAILIMGRAVQGIGAAGILSGALFLGSLVAPLTMRSMIVGMLGGTAAVAMVSAPMLGSAFAAHVNWRWCFYTSIPICTVIIVIILYCLHEVGRPRSSPRASGVITKDMDLRQRFLAFSRKLDLLGVLILLPLAISLLLALQLAGRKYEWNSWLIIILLLVTIIFILAFVYSQHKAADDALLPLRFFKKRTVISSFWFMLCISAAALVVTKFIPLWFQLILSYPNAVAATCLWPMLVGTILGSLGSIVFVYCFGHYAPLLIFGTLLMSVGAGLLTTWNGATAGSMLLTVVPAAVGLGFGTAFQQPFVAVQASLADSDDLSLGFSIVAFAQALGSSVMILIAENLFANSLADTILEKTGISVTPNQALKFDLIKTTVQKVNGATTNLTDAYNKSFTQAFVLSVVMAALSVIGALAVRWRNVKEAERRAAAQAKLTMNEKQQKYQYRSNNPNSYSPRNNQASMAYNIIDSNKQGSPGAQPPQQNFVYELDASRPQPYDQSGTKKESPYSQSSQQFSVGTVAVNNSSSIMENGPDVPESTAGSGPYQSSPYEMQRTQGLGLSGGGFYNGVERQASTSSTGTSPRQFRGIY
ncbi:hypothetical protein MGG_10598 [Pyricularia oryzae 70-15]|uniref:Major facilitator superfamily (MFS) profile domain-containing protein n=3 Tax=Pyricularia oryzae TaxID=318829 RepID=G5EHP2_PYRO7|nr:uncharacterized protein MGG_10598 [Pyricularia oryzae 70-15]ELQ40834.1 transporter protein [Pyricularia oryzae Y34]KAI7912363.1 hypothetical protein M0657_010482 [Pyricularia oryzae]EAQ70744.1 hypothetical protein MGCH7_ch7g151 [Pyricularia oryzae 70-15]EHA46601.1 hypothetical protein MGG_10598 [Pyricularia oryzae 70-15]KAI7912557.1 hypothetical protein M9X92_009951 [Pyricularia oryzae]